MILARVRWQHDRDSELHDTNVIDTGVHKITTEDDGFELKGSGKGELRNVLSSLIWRVDSCAGGFVELYRTNGELAYAHPERHASALNGEPVAA